MCISWLTHHIFWKLWEMLGQTTKEYYGLVMYHACHYTAVPVKKTYACLVYTSLAVHHYYQLIIIPILFQCNGKEISWSHLVQLYYHNRCQSAKSNPGFALIPKLKYEHINLSSFSKMRVDLAAQVCAHTFMLLYNITAALIKCRC